MFEQAFKNIDNVLWKEAGCTSELDYTEQSSWLLFLKYLDGLEQDKAKIKNVGNAGRNGGEYYSPRPLVRAIVRVVKPQIGEKISDDACGSCGFLCESFDYLRSGNHWSHGKNGSHKSPDSHSSHLSSHLTTKDLHTLQTSTFYGREKKSLAYVIGIMNKILKAGGRAGVIIKNTFLSNTDNVSVSLRKLLLESCNLHTILDCPGGTFQGAGVKTVVLFFEKGSPTRTTWYYKLDPGRNMGKTNPLSDDDLAEFIELQATFADSPKSWSVDAATIDQTTFDLSAKNPNGGEEVVHRSPEDIMDEIAALDAESAEVLLTIRGLL